MVSSLQHEVSVAKLKLLELERAVGHFVRQQQQQYFDLIDKNAELECLLRRWDGTPDFAMSMKYGDNIQEA
jgi:hypothetical protein